MPALILATLLLILSAGGFSASVSSNPVEINVAGEAHTPQIAIKGSFAALVFGSGSEVYFSASQDGGRTFSKAAVVNRGAGGVLPLTRHRGPHVAISGNTVVVSAVVGHTAAQGLHAHGLPSDGDLLVWRSNDQGKTWLPVVRVNDVPGAPTEGLHTLAVSKDGVLFAAWLDKRDPSGTQLFGARSTDRGATWAANQRIYRSPEGTICQCCAPSAIFTSTGEVAVMWRNVLDGARDFYLTLSRDGTQFSTPKKLGQGTWKINACPMDGGGVVSHQGKIYSAWRRESDVFLAQEGQEETRLARGHDVAIAAGGDGVYVAWSNNGQILLLPPNAASPVVLVRAGAYVTLADIESAGVLAAWEQAGAIQVQRVAGRSEVDHVKR